MKWGRLGVLVLALSVVVSPSAFATGAEKKAEQKQPAAKKSKEKSPEEKEKERKERAAKAEARAESVRALLAHLGIGEGSVVADIG
ncbi:MAG: hypothetical protein ABIK89_15075, partial [Planctomycetota bacterium]